jgi:GNAT superfamily N-acetyltransferase
VGPAYRPLDEARLIDALAAQLPDPEPDHHYLWMETDSRPGTMSGEVEWLDADQALRAGPLFDRFFPGSYAKPGASAHRWAEAVAEPDGEPLAVAADAWSARGCGYLAGVVTHPDARGRGLSRAVRGFVLEQVRTPDHHSRRLLRLGSWHGPGHHVLAEHLDPQPAHRPHRPPAHPEADDSTTITELLAEFADRKAAGHVEIPERMVIYSFRHFFASNCLTNGIPITDVAEWMGHRSLDITFKIYRHLMPGSIGKAAKILDMGLAA